VVGLQRLLFLVFCESQHTKKEGFLFKGKVFCGKLKTTVGVKKTFLPIFWWVKRITIHDFRKIWCFL
jgi:hypothetical protein